MFLAGFVLPPLIIALKIVAYSSTQHSDGLAGLGIVFAIYFWWPAPVASFFGFILALAWKQGLETRIEAINRKANHASI